MNIFTKLKLYSSYKKIIRKNKNILFSEFGLKIDIVNRLYTVINIPETEIAEPYNVRKSDIEILSGTYIKTYVNRLSNYLNSIGLTELYDFYDAPKKLDKYTYLIIFGFKPFNTVKFNNILWYGILPISIVLFIIGLCKIL